MCQYPEQHFAGARRASSLIGGRDYWAVLASTDPAAALAAVGQLSASAAIRKRIGLRCVGGVPVAVAVIRARRDISTVALQATLPSSVAQLHVLPTGGEGEGLFEAAGRVASNTAAAASGVASNIGASIGEGAGTAALLTKLLVAAAVVGAVAYGLKQVKT